MNSICNLGIISILVGGLNLAKASESRQVYLKQIDFRKRVGVSTSIPGVSRLRLRFSFEHRYRPEQRLIDVTPPKRSQKLMESEDKTIFETQDIN